MGGTSNHNGKLFFMLQDVTNVYKGRIGTSTKVCCKTSVECSKSRHKSNKVEDLKPGYYAKANEFEFLSIRLYQFNLWPMNSNNHCYQIRLN